MMADLWSPEGWKQSLPAPPWPKAYDKCMHIENKKEYKNKCKAKDRGAPITCWYKKYEECGAVFIRMQEDLARECFAHRQKPDDT